MYRSIYDRFQGCWWGSVIGQNWVNQPLATSQVSDLLAQPWLQERKRIGEILLKQKLVIDNLNELFSALAFSSPANKQNAVKNLKYNSSLLPLLPLIIFTTDNQNVCQKFIAKHNLKSANPAKNSFPDQDILIWSYLITTVINHQGDLLLNNQLIEEVIISHQLPKSTLRDKLSLVSQAIKQGCSLHQLSAQVSSKGGHQSTAIAIAWYCFATTPRDFRLSIQRANQVKPNLALLTTVLTGTLSGAYNGMTSISCNWRFEIENSSCWHQENQLLVKLFKSWLGIYDAEKNDVTHNLDLEAIAPPRLIQPRQSLKIISQSSLPIVEH